MPFDSLYPDPPAAEPAANPLDINPELVTDILVRFLREELRSAGFARAVIGMSGGIDSAVTACLAVAAIGPGNVTGVLMPSRYSSAHSVADAEALAGNLGIRALTFPIDGVVRGSMEALTPIKADVDAAPDAMTEQNLQARARGALLMAHSNTYGSIVLTTGNKSELAVGYCTLYGDMCGGLAVISDVPNLLLQDHQLLSERVNAWGGADVVIIDTLAQTTPGSNENSSEDMGKALSHIRAMHSATGAMMLLVHHAGKDLTRGARGWSGIKAAADSEIEITRDGDQRQVRVSKQKDGEDGLSLHFVLREVALGFDTDGDAITSCIVEYVDPPASGERVREPGGTWPAMVWRAVLEMHELTGDGADREAVLQRAIDQMPRDPDKDRRRENARRALEGLVKGEWVRMDGEQVCVMASKLPRSARG